MQHKPLLLNLLGTPEIRWQGASISLSRRQARALLYRLAVEMQPVTRDALLLLLWPDLSEAIVRRNLTRLLSALRHDLPDFDILQTTRTTIMLNPGLTWSDAAAFMVLTSCDDKASWEEAVTLYRDPFLSGFSMPNSAEFDMWQSQQQQIYERRFLATLARLVAAKRQAGQYNEAIDYAQRYLAIDELSEEMHLHLIELYAETGDRSLALRQFEHCVLVLERELGVPPLPETRAAYETIRNGRHLAEPEKAPEPEWATLPSLHLPLIGRKLAWDTLETAHSRFRNGGVIFISGEPGVGKSRLMQEFATACAGLVLSGNNDAREQIIPYQSLIQVLRQALPLHSRWTHTLPIWLAELSRLMPEIFTYFPELPSPIDVEPQQAQARMFEALRQVFTSLASDSPLLLCLDNVHWADDSTHGWLHYITRQLAGSDICILATYRSHQQSVLSEWQRTLKRAGIVADIQLTGVTETAVSDILSQVNEGVTPVENWAALIHEATDGNAFFVLETIRELLETGQFADLPGDLPLPSTVRDAILRRARRLSPLAQQILEVTAVLSPSAAFPVIHETAGRDEMDTANSLEELTTRHLLLFDGDQFRFQHELAREAIYQSISSWRRRLLHRRAANILANALHGEPVELAMIASHFEAASDRLRAIDYYQQAAAAATTVYAHQEAIHHLKRAIKLATAEKAEPAVLPQLYEALADNLAIAGEFAAAEASYRAGLALVANDDPLIVAELERKLAATLNPQQRENEAETIYRAALARLDEMPPTADTHQWKSIRLNILIDLLDALYFQQRPEAMAELNKQTQVLLDKVGTPEQQSNFYSRLNQMATLQNRYRISAGIVPMAQKALAYAQESGQAWLIVRKQFHVGFQLLWRGDLGEAEEMLQQALAKATEGEDAWSQTQCLVYLTILYRFQGSITQVTAYLSPLIEISKQIGNSLYIGVTQANRAWLYYRSGDWVQAQTLAEAAVTNWAVSPYPFHWLAHWLLLALALRQNRLKEAITAAQAMLDPKQQLLPHEIDVVLATAVAAWEANDEMTARDCLETAVTLATRYGYL